MQSPANCEGGRARAEPLLGTFASKLVRSHKRSESVRETISALGPSRQGDLYTESRMTEHVHTFIHSWSRSTRQVIWPGSIDTRERKVQNNA